MQARRALGMAALLLMAVPAVLANHAQPLPGGGTITFKDKGGNEWWVEAVVTSSSPVSKVEVMDDGGPWATMAHRPEWGSWALSYHVEPGHRVTFRATTAAGTATSCPFTHPAGAEQCDSQPPPPPPPPGTFDASFALVRGNEWWIQAQVKANAGFTLGKVEVSTNSGLDWKPLAKQSWGTSMYAASYHLPQGTVVQLRATATSGHTDVSACYQWIPASGQDANAVSCGQAPTGLEWHTYYVDDVTEHLFDLSIGDADRDGKPELYASGDEGLKRYTGEATTTVDAGSYSHITVADGDSDGKAEVYAIGRTTAGLSTVTRFSWSGTAWTSAVIYTAPAATGLGPVTVGDVDNDGKRELYIGRETSSAASILRLSRETGTWQATVIANFGDDGRFLSVTDLWVGDGDRDGKLELAVAVVGFGYGKALLVEKGTAWTFTELGGWGGAPAGIVAGDVDRDGRGEVVAADDSGILHHFRFVGGAWQAQDVDPGTGGFTDIFLGDGDNDGRQEIYGSSWDDKAYRIVQGAGPIAVTEIVDYNFEQGSSGPNLIIVGDGDGDGRREAYTTIFSFSPRQEYIYRHQLEAPFKATFSNVKGNEWWVEAVITANYPVHAVMLTVNCDTSKDPHDMSYNPTWGKWTLGNTHIPSGSKITMTAHGDWGSAESQGFIMPNGTPTSGC